MKSPKATLFILGMLLLSGARRRSHARRNNRREKEGRPFLLHAAKTDRDQAVPF
jgi:hypothetical protein